MESLISELVAIESVNPGLVASGSGESAIAGYVASWLRDAGLEVEIVEPVRGRPSVVSVLRGSGGMSSPFSPVVSAGRIYGRGAYDMKASLAAIMVTAREAAKLRLKGDLIVTAVADEEVASLGTSAVLERFHADVGIVTEPTEPRLCLAHKGFVWLEVETSGVAAHGSLADLGVDAIAHMGGILSGVLDLDRNLRDGPRHELLGTGSIHASLIEGGQEMSTYPARCVASLERRTVPGEDSASVLREIEGVASPPHSLGRARVGAPATVRVLLERPPSEAPADHRVSVAVAEAAQNPVIIGVAYWMDMALLNAAGIPTVAFGPEGEGAHADVEWVNVASVEKCVEVYIRAAELLCN